ncbi:MAG TPA: tetratricopeptide repeat protein [Opitutaceae bacterium]|nr:tetratricopeptide repeat protein [Opitutaceae bacterium]
MPRFLPAHPRLRTALVGALLFAATVVVFSRALRCGFVNYDDPGYVTENAHVQGGLSRADVVWAFTGAADYWHPLTWLSHMLDWQLYGPDARGHHLTSVLWHALAAVLAFLLFRRFGAGLWLGAFAAALFAWHPLRVESVVWVTERKDVMSGCFFLLTLLAYARYASRRAAGRAAWPAYLLTLAFFVAGLMSKPMLVSLPFVLLVLDFWPLARAGATSRLRLLLLEKLPFLALAGAAATVTVLMQRQAGALVLDLPFGARAANAVVSLARYLGKFVWPVNLIACYPLPGAWPARAVLGAGVLGLGLSWLGWRERRRRPWIAAGWLFFLVVLLPVLGLVQAGIQAMADRYTYLPLLGIEIAGLWTLRPAWRTAGGRAAAAAAGALVLAACVARTWNQEGVWRDSVTLFTHATAVSARNDVAEDFLASALFAAGRFDESEVHAERALALNPKNANALVRLAGLRDHQGRLPEAADLLQAALALRPDQPDVQCQLGLLELRQGRLDEARRLMLPVLRADPARRALTLRIGRDTALNGSPQAAQILFDLVLEVAPDDPEALIDSAEVHARARDFAAAARLCRHAVAVVPNNSRVHVALGSVLLLTGDRAGAVAQWRRAYELDPGYPGLRELLSNAGRQP